LRGGGAANTFEHLFNYQEVVSESDEFFEAYSDKSFDCANLMRRAGSSRGVPDGAGTM